VNEQGISKSRRSNSFACIVEIDLFIGGEGKNFSFFSAVLISCLPLHGHLRNGRQVGSFDQAKERK